MQKRILLFLPMLLYTIASQAQLQNEVDKLLQAKDFISFKNYTSELSKNYPGTRPHWEYLRDLVGDYQEGVFFYDAEVKGPDASGVFTVQPYKVNVITQNSTIIYFFLGREHDIKNGDYWITNYDVADKFKDVAAFEALRNKFRNIFHIGINEDELFETDIVYGSHCGFTGSNPKWRLQTDTWLQLKNKPALIQWLQSTNTEKQVYAVDALYQLKLQGTEFTNDELKMINAVLHKKGTVQTCTGCIYSNAEISMVTAQFKF